MTKQAESVILISRVIERFPIQQVLHKVLPELPLIHLCIKSTILANHCISCMGREYQQTESEIK